MLQARKIPLLLQGGLGDGISTLVLMTTEGSVLSSVTNSKSKASPDILLGALASSFWLNILKEQSEVEFHSIKLEKAIIGVASITGKGYLIAAYGDENVGTGFLKARILSLKSNLSRIFEQL